MNCEGFQSCTHFRALTKGGQHALAEELGRSEIVRPPEQADEVGYAGVDELLNLPFVVCGSTDDGIRRQTLFGVLSS